MAQAPTEASPPQAPRKKLSLILLATGVILGGAGVVAFLSRGAKTAEGAAGGEPGHAGDEAALLPPGEPGVVPLDPFVLNLADPEGDRFLRLSLRVVLDRAERAEAAASDLEQTRLRDLLLIVLSAKTADEITSFEGKEALRKELQQALAPRFEGARVLDVYFTEFLVQ